MLQRSDLVKNLAKIRVGLCSYLGPPCDCKFGADNIESKYGEQTGCPELYLAISVLDIMTDEEYGVLLRRRLERCW